MAEDTPIWKIKPHTKAKHQILDRYLKGWFPILSKHRKRIVYIDGFAGPGIYLDGEPGSPIIALNVLKNHVIEMNAIMILIFIEQNAERCSILQKQVDRIDLPDNIKVQVICDTFESKLTELFDYLEEQEKTLAPSFVFIDPFGYSQTPIEIIERLMSFPHCEFMITFMYDFINRFINEPDRAKVFDKLFGTDEWIEIDKQETSEERKKFIHDLYMKQLNSRAQVKYIRSFEMMNKFNHTEYFLVYGTNHIKGLQLIKEAMWSVDPTGEYTFSDNTDPTQTVLFEIEPNFQQLKELILAEYKGKTVSIDDLETFVIESPFRKTHLRKPILIPMEGSDSPEIEVNNRTRKKTYPKGTLIHFL